MSDTDSAKEQPTGTLRRVLLDLSAPKSAHLLSWTRVSSQILLEVGYFDLHSVQQQSQPGVDGERVLEWFITDRFVIDFETAVRMADQFAQLGKYLSELKEKDADGSPG